MQRMRLTPGGGTPTTTPTPVVKPPVALGKFAFVVTNAQTGERRSFEAAADQAVDTTAAEMTEKKRRRVALPPPVTSVVSAAAGGGGEEEEEEEDIGTIMANLFDESKAGELSITEMVVVAASAHAEERDASKWETTPGISDIRCAAPAHEFPAPAHEFGFLHAMYSCHGVPSEACLYRIARLFGRDKLPEIGWTSFGIILGEVTVLSVTRLLTRSQTSPGGALVSLGHRVATCVLAIEYMQRGTLDLDPPPLLSPQLVSRSLVALMAALDQIRSDHKARSCSPAEQTANKTLLAAFCAYLLRNDARSTRWTEDVPFLVEGLLRTMRSWQYVPAEGVSVVRAMGTPAQVHEAEGLLMETDVAAVRVTILAAAAGGVAGTVACDLLERLSAPTADLKERCVAVLANVRTEVERAFVGLVRAFAAGNVDASTMLPALWETVFSDARLFTPSYVFGALLEVLDSVAKAAPHGAAFSAFKAKTAPAFSA